MFYGLCVECKEHSVYIKKYALCQRCYGRAYRLGKLGAGSRVHKENGHKIQSMHKREMEFVKNYFSHRNWKYEPCTFAVMGSRIVPDFYDGERNVFIEVIGSRQRYWQNKDKYDLFCKEYPHFSFELRMPDGSRFDPDNPKWREHGAYPSKVSCEVGVDISQEPAIL